MNDRKKQQPTITTYLSESDDDFKIISKLMKTKEGLRELRKRDSFTDKNGEKIPKPALNNKDIKTLKSIIPNWEEMVFLLGQWEESDSFIFMDASCENVFCVSKKFLEDMLKLYK